VTSKNRYILDEESSAFLNAILDTCQSRIKKIEKCSYVWRAQDGHEWRSLVQEDPDTLEEIYIDDLPCPYSFNRMKPLVDSASEGRANPKGIPCLYVATDKETAMSEVRPWLGSIVTVACFKTIRALQVIDFSVGHGKKNTRFYLEEPTPEKIIEAVWFDLDNAFSRPTKTSDLKSDYAPTQIIAEFLKTKGYDGVAYKSSLADGYNVALFDLDAAEVCGCSLYEVSNIKFDFKKVHE
jgi:hypothetical protein